MRFTIPLRKLSELDVKYISLVNRGANRIPFRIIKQEHDMIDLSRLGLRVKKADTQATAKGEPQDKPEAVLTAVVLAKNDESLITTARSVLSEHGIDLPDTQVFKDGTVALCKGGYEDGAVIRIDENMAVVLKAFDPWSSSTANSSFPETVASRGFFDNVRVAMTVASDLLDTAMFGASSPAEAATAVKKVMDDLSAYVVGLAKALPTAVFKVEKVIGEAVAKASGTQKKPEDGDAAEAGKGKKSSPAGDKAAQADATDGTAPAEGGDKNPDKGGVEGADGKSKKKLVSMEEVASTMETSLASILEALSTMADKMKSLSETVSAAAQRVEAVEKSTEQKIDVLTQKVDTATRAIRGIVVASETLGDADSAPTKVTKQDTDPRRGVFDTAFIRR